MIMQLISIRLAVAFSCIFLPTLLVAQPGQTRPCEDNPVHRQFDFWIGEWEVTNPQGQMAGSNLIERSENGCLLLENWTSASGGSGKSMNYYDPEEKAWKQVWVDAGGNVGYFSGGLEGEAMHLSGKWVNPDGTSYLLRGTWTPLSDGRVRQHFEQSNDEGKTWSTWFDGYYKRK